MSIWVYATGLLYLIGYVGLDSLGREAYSTFNWRSSVLLLAWPLLVPIAWIAGLVDKNKGQ